MEPMAFLGDVAVGYAVEAAPGIGFEGPGFEGEGLDDGDGVHDLLEGMRAWRGEMELAQHGGDEVEAPAEAVGVSAGAEVKEPSGAGGAAYSTAVAKAAPRCSAMMR